MKKDDHMLPLKFSDRLIDTKPIIVDCERLVPFQFRTQNASTGSVTAYLCDYPEGGEQVLALDIQILQSGTWMYYVFDGTTSIDQGRYYLRLVDGLHTYYSVPFEACCLEPLGNDRKRRDDLFLPLRFMEAPFNFKPITADNNYLLPFQFRTTNPSTGTPEVYIVDREGNALLTDIELTVLQTGKWTYYTWSGRTDTVPVGVYHLRVDDGAFSYYSVPFEVCDIEEEHEDIFDVGFGYLYKFISGGGDPFGALYNWYAATDERELANTGWHVPSKAEWEQLRSYLDPVNGTDENSNNAGSKMKEFSLSYWEYDDGYCLNTSGFNARGSGARSVFYDDTVQWDAILQSCAFWSTDELSPGSSQAHNPTTNIGQQNLVINYVAGYKREGCSVRLVKNDGNLSNYTGNDGRIYKTVKIGDQVWMAENLKETRYHNGDLIPVEENDEAWVALSTGAMCYYGNEKRKEIAPFGWHVPTGEEMIALAEAIDTGYTYSEGHGGDNVAGKEMKESGNEYWLTNAGTNSTGFNARGAGCRTHEGVFLELRSSFIMWTNRYNYYTDDHYFTGLYHNEDWFNVGDYKINLGYGFSVRLVRDDTPLSEGQHGTMTGNDGKVYSTKVIGGKEWMTQNLAETKYRDGTDIPKITDAGAWAAATEGYCAYDNDENNV